MSVTVNTSHGSFEVQLYWKDCPKACESFLARCADDTFNGTSAGRNEAGFLLQFPNKTPSIFPDMKIERKPTIRHVKGSIGLLKPKYAGFYITYTRQPELDDQKTIFGRVKEGMDTLAKLESQACEDGIPTDPITITSMIVTFNPFALKAVGQLV